MNMKIVFIYGWLIEVRLRMEKIGLIYDECDTDVYIKKGKGYVILYIKN